MKIDFLIPWNPNTYFTVFTMNSLLDKPNTYHTYIMYATPTTGLTNGTGFFLSI